MSTRTKRRGTRSPTVWIATLWPRAPIYHRLLPSWWETVCGHKISGGVGHHIPLRHAEMFGRPCRHCWTAEELEE